jgi:hypothetical protein
MQVYTKKTGPPVKRARSEQCKTHPSRDNSGIGGITLCIYVLCFFEYIH